MGKQLSRRDFLTAVGGASVVALGGSRISKTDLDRMAAQVRTRGADTIKAASSIKAAGKDLGAVEHVIFLMHENRSFDHYFGTLGGVNGFDATSSAFAQSWPGGASSTLLPFHLDVKKQQAECTYDLSHSWQAEHASWNNGAMDSFVSTHTSAGYEGDQGVVTMGYYEKADIPFYYDLAKKFTICDDYFCSVLGPTHPNRLMQMTGTLDPAGVAGGPILVTNSSESLEGTCSWTTMPEILSDASISWKCYNPYGSGYQPGNAASMLLCKNVLMYFDQYTSDTSSALYDNAFNYYGPNVSGGFSGGVGPNDFASDVANDTLPQVSWIIPPVGFDEHPPAPALLGEWFTQQILDTLTSNAAVWSKTVLFIMYDENDGWFDHVAPKTAPADTAGEYVTSSNANVSYALGQPIGMGFRVPMLVVSPFSAGGYVCHDTFDHTSQLQFLETLFGVTNPNISAWRRANTSTLENSLPLLGGTISTKAPKLPKVAWSSTEVWASGGPAPVDTECSSTQVYDEINKSKSTPAFPVPTKQKQPKQHGTLKTTPS